MEYYVDGVIDFVNSFMISRKEMAFFLLARKEKGLNSWETKTYFLKDVWDFV